MNQKLISNKKKKEKKTTTNVEPTWEKLIEEDFVCLWIVPKNTECYRDVNLILCNCLFVKTDKDSKSTAYYTFLVFCLFFELVKKQF